MIEIKRTRAAAPDEAPSRERYTQNTGTVFSNAPIVIALLLAGFVGYLRTFFPGFASERSVADDAPREPEPKEPRPKPRQEAAAPQDAHEDEGDKDGKGGGEPKAGGSATPPDILAPEPVDGVQLHREARSFVMIDSPSFTYFVPDLAVKTNNGQFQFRPRISNDNLGGGTSGDVVGSLPQRGNGPARPATGESDDGEDDDNSEPSQNRAPRSQGPVYLGEFVGGHAAVIALVALLQNVDDADGDSLTISNVAVSAGTLTPVAGGFLYTPEEGTAGFGTLSYSVSDGTAVTTHSARFRIVEHHALAGTEGDDLLVGTAHADAVEAGAGHDNVDAGDGDDLVSGGHGDDHLVAGKGDDLVIGGSGNDLIFGGAGDDVIHAGAGDDRVYGEDGHDILHGGHGDDLLVGGAGDDALFGDAGDDELQGGDGADILHGGEGRDRLSGGAGADILDGGEGADHVDGGEGEDVIIASLDVAPDTYDGGAGEDLLDLSATRQGVLVDLTTGRAVGVEVGDDAIAGIERIIGGEGDDTFVIDLQPVSLRGGGGSDHYRFSTASLPDAGPQTVHAIQDFMVEDRIFLNDAYRIARQVDAAVTDLFSQVYGEHHFAGGRSIRYRNEEAEDMVKTRIEADLNGDTHYELAIHLDGHHVLFVAENLA